MRRIALPYLDCSALLVTPSLFAFAFGGVQVISENRIALRYAVISRVRGNTTQRDKCSETKLLDIIHD